MAKIEIEVGRSLDDVGADFVTAWQQAGHGSVPNAVEKIVFCDWSALYGVLTPQRFELLRTLRAKPNSTEAGLAQALGRDPDSVQGDVAALQGLGLINRGESGEITVPMAAILSTIHLAA